MNQQLSFAQIKQNFGRASIFLYNVFCVLHRLKKRQSHPDESIFIWNLVCFACRRKIVLWRWPFLLIIVSLNVYAFSKIKDKLNNLDVSQIKIRSQLSWKTRQYVYKSNYRASFERKAGLLKLKSHFRYKYFPVVF